MIAVIPPSFLPTSTFVPAVNDRSSDTSVSPSLWAAAPMTRKFSTRRCAKYTDSPADGAVAPSSPVLGSPGENPAECGDKGSGRPVGRTAELLRAAVMVLPDPADQRVKEGRHSPQDLALIANVESKEAQLKSARRRYAVLLRRYVAHLHRQGAAARNIARWTSLPH